MPNSTEFYKQPDIASVSSLIGDAARASMLLALLGGKALTVGELANEANVTLPTASSHLSKLVKGNLLVVRKQGRHKYFQLRNSDVAGLLESLLVISADVIIPTVQTGPSNVILRRARICYDHLAGEIAVGLLKHLKLNGFVVDDDGQLSLSLEGDCFFSLLGVDLVAISQSKNKRPVCKSCMDWSERQCHLAGRLGQWILTDLIKNKWAHQQLDSRAIVFSASGLKQFNKRYKIPST